MKIIKIFYFSGCTGSIQYSSFTLKSTGRLKWFQPFCSESGRLKWVVDLSVKNRSQKIVKNPSKYLPKTLLFSFSRPSGAFFFQSGRLNWVVDLSRKKATIFKTQVVDLKVHFPKCVSKSTVIQLLRRHFTKKLGKK